VKDETSLALTYDLFQLMKQLPRLMFRQYSLDGLTQGEQGLLAMLVMNFDGSRQALKVTELSNLLQITPAGVTHLLNPLEESGHIERLQDPRDRRIVRVGLTDKGTQAAQVLMGAVQEQLAGLLDHLGEEDSKTLIRLLTTAVGYFAAQTEKSNGSK
jgi:DNA-binding MarR family transcriptional regulator